MTRREFIVGAVTAGAFGGCRTALDGAWDRYSVAVLGDTHFDAEPESVYHAHYDESNRWAAIQHAEFRRNGEMWRGRCRDLLAASARLAHERPTQMILQTGDIIQGDCDDAPTHRKMLDDCIRMLRTPYPAGLLFLTVVGNHDFRGKGAWDAYFQFAEPFLSKELGVKVRYPAFAFRRGPDRWIFCNFENHDLKTIADLVEADPAARHVFLVTHGPFTCADDSSHRWRLGGSRACDEQRPLLYRALSRRHAVVLSGHTHTVAWYRHENEFGGFSEFTCNSVWMAPELATAKPVCEGAARYGERLLAEKQGDALKDFRQDLDFFRPGLKDYFYGDGAGHFRLNVSDAKVDMEFYPGDALVPARTFPLFAS